MNLRCFESVWRRTGFAFGPAALAVSILGSGCATSRAPDAVQVSEVTLHADMECFKVETPRATYFYGKRGAGFASIVDPAGHDWISYRPGGKALGEYRGLPKCGQPTKYFHCGYGFGQYTNDNWFTSRVVEREPAHVRIESRTRNDDSACTWDFYATHATMTLLRIGQPTYWFLYEGTPGGKLDAADDFALRPGGKRTPLTEPWNAVVRWVAFGAGESPYALFLIDHTLGGDIASYVSWPYKPEADGALNQMTVFGFGRPPWTDPRQHQPQLNALPARLTIGLADASDPARLTRTIESLR